MSGRQLLLCVVVGLLLLAGLLFYFMGESAWRLWNIPVMRPSFADARSILTGVVSQRLGYDPLVQSPADPFGRPMGYPRLWLLLGLLPLSPVNTPALAAVEIALFIAALFIFVDRLDPHAVPWMTAILISPAAMLCFERGNPDLVAFFLLAVALAQVGCLPVFAVVVTELAAMLKLYPAIALGMLLRLTKKAAAVWLLAGFAVFAAYMAFTWRDVQQVLSMSPKGVGFNYGATVIGLWLLDMTGSSSVERIALAVSYVAVYLVLVAALYRSHRGGPAPMTSQRSLDAFRVGTLVYVGTFIQGNTWNYRLIFLVFVVPQLVEWWRGDVLPWRRAGLLALVLVLVSAWSPLLGASEPPAPAFPGILQVLMDELFNWGLLGVLSYLFFASLPEWIRDDVGLFFEKHWKAVRARA